MANADGWVRTTQRSAIVLGGLFGAVGVMAAAGASHAETRNLSAIAMIGLAHGPTLLALGLAARGRAFAVAALLLSAGTGLFIADLGWREWQGAALVTGAAPLGGGAMIFGWLTVALGGVIGQRADKNSVA